MQAYSLLSYLLIATLVQREFLSCSFHLGRNTMRFVCIISICACFCLSGPLALPAVAIYTVTLTDRQKVGSFLACRTGATHIHLWSCLATADADFFPFFIWSNAVCRIPSNNLFSFFFLSSGSRRLLSCVLPPKDPKTVRTYTYFV